MPLSNSEARASLRELNLSAVLRFVYHEAPLSRAQLAARTGLNKSTVSSLVEDLLDRRLIHETGTNYAGKGRPATLLEISPHAGAVVAVEMGVDFVSAAVVDLLGNIRWRKAECADPAASQAATLKQTQVLIDEAIEASQSIGQRMLGLSFSIPGTVDIKQGALIFAPNLKWRDVRFRQIFSSRTQVKIFIENDANAAAIAEHLFGVARNVRDFLFVFIGVGLGGGLFLNDRLYRGMGGYAGEIGHTPIIAEPFQKPCPCGNVGCWETYVNQSSILDRVERLLAESDEHSLIVALMRDQDSPLSLSIVIQAAAAADRIALHALAEAGTAIGTGLAVLVNLFNPQKIVLGGPVIAAGKYLMPSIRESLHEHGMREIRSQSKIDVSAFGADASLIGAAAVVINDILMCPWHVEKEVMPRNSTQPIAVST